MATIKQETFIRCENYQEAQKQSRGYEDTNLIDNLVKNIKKNPPWETANNPPNYIEYRQLELLSALMRIFCENLSITINVADIGGGNGYLAMAPKENLPMISWNWLSHHMFNLKKSLVLNGKELMILKILMK